MLCSITAATTEATRLVAGSMRAWLFAILYLTELFYHPTTYVQSEIHDVYTIIPNKDVLFYWSYGAVLQVPSDRWYELVKTRIKSKENPSDHTDNNVGPTNSNHA